MIEKCVDVILWLLCVVFPIFLVVRNSKLETENEYLKQERDAFLDLLQRGGTITIREKDK